MIRIAWLAPFLLAACNQQPAGEPITRVEIGERAKNGDKLIHAQSACLPLSFEGAVFTHCIADPEKHRIEMAVGDNTGTTYRSLSKYAEHLGDFSANVAFAMNGGMYDDDGLPIGYYVEGGDRLHELNQNDGSGNFHLKPNGVFFGTSDRWQVMTSDSFYANVGDRPEFGTQSGPMLVINGKLHPEIAEDGPSKAIRNAVGVDETGKAHFVIAETPISFGIIARLFRDELKTPNALFLDGNISALWDPATGRLDTGPAIGPIIVVTKRE